MPEPALEGADVLRDLDEPLVPKDAVGEMRSALAVRHAHFRANTDAVGAVVERIVHAVVFRGCAPVLVLVFMFILGVIWALGTMS